MALQANINTVAISGQYAAEESLFSTLISVAPIHGKVNSVQSCDSIDTVSK